MSRALLAVLALLAPAPSLAQQQAIPPPPGGVAVTAEGRMVMSSGVCTVLGGLAPSVPGADYVPGVDVNGNAVAPADLPSSAPPMALENFPIEIGVNLKKRFGLAAGSQFFRGKAIVGLVTVRDGRAWFNGAPLADNERDMMTAACKETKR